MRLTVRTLVPAPLRLVAFAALTFVALPIAADDWTLPSSMAAARTQHSATLLPDGKVLVVGGVANGQALASVETFDPLRQTWSPAPLITQARYDHAAVLLRDGRVLVTGGSSAASLSSTRFYDPLTNLWTLGPPMTRARSGHTATVLMNGDVLVVGGVSSPGIYEQSAELLTPGLQNWTPLDLMVTGRYHHTATLLPNGQVLVAGGANNGGALTSAEVFDPNSSTWHTVSDMAFPRESASAVALGDGRVLIAGGLKASSSPTPSAELFDGFMNWQPAGSMSIPRYAAAACPLQDGRVLVTGGFSAPQNSEKSVDLFDPAQGRWTPTATMFTPRANHTAVPLQDGTVLVAGGVYAGSPLATAEIFRLSPVEAPRLLSATGWTGIVGVPFSFRIDASGSPPPDLRVDILPPGLSLSGNLISGVPLQQGIFHTTLTATNQAGFDMQTLTFTFDPRPNNTPPVAVAGQDQTVEAQSPAGGSVTLDGSHSFDPDGDTIINYRWSGDFGSIDSDRGSILVTLPLGTHLITLTVFDGSGGVSTPVSITVTVQDTTRPAFLSTRERLYGCGIAESSPDLIGHLYRVVCSDDGGGSLEQTYDNPDVVTPYGIAFTPAGELYLGNTGNSARQNLLRFRNPSVDPASELPSRPFIAASYGIALWGNYMFVLNGPQETIAQFQFDATGVPVYFRDFLTKGLFNGPDIRGIAIAPWGELFLSDYVGNRIHRFPLDPNGNLLPEGTPLTMGLTRPHNLAFNNKNELFVANQGGNSVSRFSVGPNDTASPLPSIVGGGIDHPMGLAFNEAGDLFVSNSAQGLVTRWSTLDPMRAIPRGSFSTPVPLASLAFFKETHVLQGITVEQRTKDGTLLYLSSPDVYDAADVAVRVSPSVARVFPLGDSNVTFTATDASGNTSSVTILVSVKDTQPPVIQAPPDMFVEQTGPLTPVSIPAPYVYDVCDTAPSVTTPPTMFPPGTTAVTFTAMDQSGNGSSATMYVTVQDTQPPQFVGATTTESLKLFATNGQDAIYRFAVNTDGTVSLEDTIQDLLGGSLSSTFGLAFGPGNVLFASNRQLSSSGQWVVGQIQNPVQSPSFLFPISSGLLGSSYGIAVRDRDLYVSNRNSNTIVHFTLDPGGFAKDGQTYLLQNPSPYGIAISPWGELFVAHGGSQPRISRHFIDLAGNLSPNTQNGTIPLGGQGGTIGLAFSPWGELFVVGSASSTVSRFTFVNGNGNALPGIPLQGNGMNAPAGATFSPSGELFVASTQPLQGTQAATSRWTFNANDHSASPNGWFLAPSTLGDLKFSPEVGTSIVLADVTVGQTDPRGALVPMPAVTDLADPNPSVSSEPRDFLPLGTTLVKYTARDAAGNIAVATRRVTVRNVAPIARDGNVVTAEDTPVQIQLQAFDTGGEVLQFRIGTMPSKGSLGGTAPNLIYTPFPDANGSDSFTFTANDGFLESLPARITIQIAPVNDAPVAANDAYSTNQGTSLSVAAPGVLANDTDVDGDPLTAAVVAGPAHGTLALNPNGSFVYTPAATYRGPDSFTYQAKDASLSSAPATVSITVQSVNHPPVARSDAYTTAEDNTLQVLAPGVLGNDFDADGDMLTAVLVSGPAHGKLTLNPDGSFVYGPASNYNGPDSFTYRASDGTATSAVATVTLNVTAVNDAPVTAPDSYTTTKNKALSVAAPGVLANDSDVEGSPLTALLVTGPSKGTLTLNTNGSFSYMPMNGFVGVDTFQYKANDGSLSSAPQTVTITVGAGNTAPVAKDDSYQVKKNTTLTVTAKQGVLLNDTDAEKDPLTAKLLVAPTRGTLTFQSDGSFIYVPVTGDTMITVTFTYVASDGKASSAPATVSLIIR